MQISTTIDKKIVLRLRNDGIYFSEKVLGVRLHYYQKEVMNDDHRFIAMCWSRQLGKTTLLAIKATHFAVTNSNKLIMILSQDRERAREFYNLVIGYIMSSPLTAQMVVGDPKQSETKLDNGTRIINKAAGRDGRSLRGYSVDLLIIDEADFIPEPVFVAGEQCTASVRGKIWLISTPFRKATTFYKYFQDGLEARRKWENPNLLDEDEKPYEAPIGRKYGFKSFWHDYTSGLKAFKSDGSTQIDESFVMKKKLSMPKWAFEQEYMALWSDDIASYFNEKQVLAVVNRDLKESTFRYNKEFPGQRVFFGIDFAKHKDRTVIWCIGKQPNGDYKTLFVKEMEGRDWNNQLEEINTLVRDMQPELIFIDKTGLGDVMLDLMMKSDYMPNGEKNYMLGRINEDTAISMQLSKKVSIYSHLQYMIGNQLIEIPNIQRCIDEFVYLQYEKTAQSEYVRIFAPEGTEEDLHDDYPDACALACQGTVDDIMFIPVAMSSIRKLGVAPLPSVSNKPKTQHNPAIDDLDAWEFQQLQKGAKIFSMEGERLDNKPGGRYKRKNGGYKRRSQVRRF